MNKINKCFFAFFLLIICIFSFNLKFVKAETTIKVIPGGESIGIKLNTGVYVAGKYEVDTKEGKIAPWQKSDIEVGDKILEIDNLKINSNADLIQILDNSKDDELILSIQRGSIEFDTTIEIITTKLNEKSLGLYIKDKLVGVGTLTFINPQTKTFASLGHGIIDQKVLLGSIRGELLVSNVDSIRKATPGNPGEKRASITNNIIGSLDENYATGLYGTINSRSLLSKQTMEVASQDEVKTGPAKIYTVIEDDEVKAYDIEIIEVNKQSTRNIKGLKIKVIDEELIDKCGGIVQGMSGSPIIQNNKLVGAISHVTIDNPLIGYGIHIEWMLQDSEA